MPSLQQQELQACFEHFLQAFLTERSEEATLAMLCSQISGFGTGRDEVVHSLEQARSLLARDFQQAPHPFKVAVHFVEPQLLDHQFGLVQAELDVHTHIDERRISLKHLRLSTLFAFEHGRWCLRHMHLSLPSDRQQEGENWPLQELEERARLLEQMVSERTHELRSALHRLQVMASTDKLTGLNNRARFDELMTTHFAHVQRYNNTASLVLLDIDHFKQVNDTYGHLFGDQVLQQLGQLIRQRTRSVDTAARWGGEEFILLLPETDLEGALKYAEKLRMAVLHQDFQTHEPLSISLGVAEYRHDPSRSAWLQRADEALYAAKQDGRNCTRSA